MATKMEIMLQLAMTFVEMFPNSYKTNDWSDGFSDHRLYVHSNTTHAVFRWGANFSQAKFVGLQSSCFHPLAKICLYK